MNLRTQIYLAAIAIVVVACVTSWLWSNHKIAKLEREAGDAKAVAVEKQSIADKREKQAAEYKAKAEYLEQQIAAHGLPREAFEWYLDLRRYGSVPHSGFGMGVERCTAWMCGIEHVREAIPFPRMLYRLKP